GVLNSTMDWKAVPTITFDPRLLNSGSASWMRALYAPLMTYNFKTGTYQPYLAKSVTASDPRTIKVVLRPDAKFDNGTPITATDAKATYEADRTNFSSGKSQGLNASVALIDNVEVVDPSTFVIHLKQDGLGAVYDLFVNFESYIVPATAGASQSLN